MTNKITALGWCSDGEKPHHGPFLASLKAYLPKDVIVYEGDSLGNFGASYNDIADKIIGDGHVQFAICNDDIVLRPDAWGQLQEDWDLLHQSDDERHKAAGVLACRHDYVRMGPQNIRFNYGRNKLHSVDFPEEHLILEVNSVAPILAVYKWNTWVDFPEINWASDDIQCHDIKAKGRTIWVSRAYCHHIGSQTMGIDYAAEQRKAYEWAQKYRPDILHLFGIQN